MDEHAPSIVITYNVTTPVTLNPVEDHLDSIFYFPTNCMIILVVVSSGNNSNNNSNNMLSAVAVEL